VKIVKLIINPEITPSGYFLLPTLEPLRIIGKTGKIHGDKIVTTPAIKAKKIKTSIKNN